MDLLCFRPGNECPFSETKVKENMKKTDSTCWGDSRLKHRSVLIKRPPT